VPRATGAAILGAARSLETIIFYAKMAWLDVVDKLLLAAASVNANRETVNCLVASRTWNSFSGRSHIAENTTNI